MVEALIALVISVFLILVFTPPAWVAKLISIGGLAFVIYVFILCIEWIVNSIPSRRP